MYFPSKEDEYEIKNKFIVVTSESIGWLIETLVIPMLFKII